MYNINVFPPGRKLIDDISSYLLSFFLKIKQNLEI
jgi:hypothetical protein